MLLLSNTAKTIFTPAKETRTFTGWISQGFIFCKDPDSKSLRLCCHTVSSRFFFLFFNLVFLQTFEDIKTILCSMDCRKEAKD